jgi:branched-chain amino acid transport system substrate-binding protein
MSRTPGGRGFVGSDEAERGQAWTSYEEAEGMKRCRATYAAGVIVGIGILALLLTGLASGGVAKTNATTIKIYNVGSLTGGADYEAIQQCNAQKLAAANINAGGGMRRGPLKGSKVDVQCIDDGLQADKAASIAAKFVADRSVWTMSGFEASGEALAAAQVAARANLTIVGSTVAADFLTTQVHNVYILQARLEPAGGSATDLCKAYYGAKKVATLNIDYSYMPTYMNGLKAAVKADGLQLVSENLWPPSTTNWGAYLTKIDSAGAQCILVGDYPPQTCQIARQAREAGMKQPVIDFNQAFTSAACQKEGGKAYEGTIFGSILPSKIAKGSFTAKIMAQYKKTYKDAMSFLAANAYNSILAVQYAVELGASNREQLGTYLAKVNGPGVGFTVRFKNKRIGARNLTYYEALANGKLDPIAEYKLLTNGKWQRLFVASCAKRPSCQKNK